MRDIIPKIVGLYNGIKQNPAVYIAGILTALILLSLLSWIN